ncbi:MAG: class D sortase [Ruthenibacterium sp.]
MMAENFKPKRRRRRRADWLKIIVVVLVLCAVSGVGLLFYFKYVKTKPAPPPPPPVMSAAERLAKQPSALENNLAEMKKVFPLWLSAHAVQQEIDDAAAAQSAKVTRANVAFGMQYGNIRVDNTSIACPLLYGDNEAQFSRGAGTSASGKLPGDGGTVLIASHTGTYFADLGSAGIGTLIHLDTDWGNYTYRVIDAHVVKETDVSACNLDATYENCILYTCYPFGQLAHTPHRWFVYAEFVGVEYP